MISERALLLVTLLMSLSVLSSCSESGDVTLHQAGVYKGARDPLLEKLRDPEMSKKLNERFYLVQGDR